MYSRHIENKYVALIGDVECCIKACRRAVHPGNLATEFLVLICLW